jgi:hypothetical protein
MIFADRNAMETWQKPQMEEIDMNAEIGGYQPDSPDDREEQPPFVDLRELQAQKAKR